MFFIVKGEGTLRYGSRDAARSAPATSSAARRAAPRPRTRSSTIPTPSCAYISVQHHDARRGLRVPRFGQGRRLRRRAATALRHMTEARRDVDYWKDEADEACSPPRRCSAIEREVAKYPPEQKQSAVMSALAIAQDEHGWLSNEVMDEVATVPRHAAGRGLRGRDVLRDVQPEAARALQGHDLHQPAVRAVGRGRGGRAPEAQARRRTSTRRPPTAASR